MSNRFASFGLPQTPGPLHRFGGRVPATRELAISPVAGDLFVVEGAGPVYALPSAPRGTLVTLLTTTALTLVNSGRLVLPGAANLVTSPNDALLMTPIADGAWQCLAILPNAGYRKRLAADLTLNVNGSTGNDTTGDGSASAPYATIQKAIDVAATLDLGGFTLTIQVANGTYTGAVSLTKPFVGGRVVLQGDTTTPSNVTISTSGPCISAVGSGVQISLKGLKLVSSASNGIYAANLAVVTIDGNMNFGACSATHADAELNAHIIFDSNYAVSGAAAAHWNAVANGIIQVIGHTITLSGTPAFSAAFAWVSGGFVNAPINTFSGSATGSRYSVQLNGIISTAGGGANYLPGNSAGSTASGGQYA